MNEDGSVERTEICPEHLDFTENKNGLLKFHYKPPIYGELNEPDDWEIGANWTRKFLNAPYIIEI